VTDAADRDQPPEISRSSLSKRDRPLGSGWPLLPDLHFIHDFTVN
jgi:hypothetical protein